MDLSKQMKEDEREIKNIVNALDSAKGLGLKAHCDRVFARNLLSGKLAHMRSLVDVAMSGRHGRAKSILEYRLCLQFPFYAHIEAISLLSGNEAPAYGLLDE